MSAPAPSPRTRARLLAVTADDFGLDPGIDAGILACVRRGGVRNVSIIPGAETRIDARARGILAQAAVGLHWMPLPPRRDLHNPADWPAFARMVRPGRARVAHELARLDRAFDALAAAGLPPVFLNGHQHLHALPGWIEPIAAWCAARGIRFLRRPGESGRRAWRARLVHPSLFAIELLGRLGQSRVAVAGVRWIPAVCRFGRAFRLEPMLDDLAASPEPALELVAHPGTPTRQYSDGDRSGIHYAEQTRELCRPDLARQFAARGFRPGRLDEIP